MSVPIALMPPPPCEPVHMRCAPMRRTPAPILSVGSGAHSHDHTGDRTGGRDLGALPTGSRSRAGLHYGAAGPHMHGSELLVRCRPVPTGTRTALIATAGKQPGGVRTTSVLQTGKNPGIAAYARIV